MSLRVPTRTVGPCGVVTPGSLPQKVNRFDGRTVGAGVDSKKITKTEWGWGWRGPRPPLRPPDPQRGPTADPAESAEVQLAPLINAPRRRCPRWTLWPLCFHNQATVSLSLSLFIYFFFFRHPTSFLLLVRVFFCNVAPTDVATMDQSTMKRRRFFLAKQNDQRHF